MHGTPSTSPADAKAVLDSIRRLVQMLRVSARAAERAVGISGAQMFILEKLAAAKQPLSVGELAERTLTHQSSVSVVVQKLERAGLVARTRSNTDGRRIELSITPRARAVLRRAPPAAQDRIINAVNAMPPARRKQLAQLLGEIAGSAAGDTPPPMLFDDSTDSDSPRKSPRARTRS